MQNIDILEIAYNLSLLIKSFVLIVKFKRNGDRIQLWSLNIVIDPFLTIFVYEFYSLLNWSFLGSRNTISSLLLLQGIMQFVHVANLY